MKAIEDANAWLTTKYRDKDDDLCAAEGVINELIKELEAYKEAVEALLDNENIIIKGRGKSAACAISNLEKLRKD